MDLSNHKYLFVISIFLYLTPVFLAGCRKEDMSLKLSEPHNIRGVVNYKRSFGNLNDIRLGAACIWGITPPASREKAENMDGKLIHTTDNEFYAVDSLTHSIPYLIPRASILFDTIGTNFLDSLTTRRPNLNKITVIFVLRTKSDVERLRCRNSNTLRSSCHFCGTTFDVNWRRLKKVEDEEGRPLQDVSADTPKLVLAEVSRNVRKADKCYIRYRLKQGYFHITTR